MLDGAEHLFLQPIGGLLVELLVGLADRGDGERQLVGGDRHVVEQPLPSLARAVSHVSSAPAWPEGRVRRR